MPSPTEAILIRFGAEWTGGAVINRIANDMARIVSSGKQMGDAFKMMGSVTGFEKQDKAIASTATSLLKYQATMGNISTELGKLGQEMTKSTEITQEHTDKYLALARAAQNAEAGLAEAVPGVSKFSGALAAATPIVLAVGAALVVGAKAFSEWREAAEEGAKVRQLGDSFQFLTQNLMGVPGLLQEMRAASRGTISDYSLMSSTLTLTAGVSRELGSELLANAPRLLEIAKAANILNPALGDTTFFFDSLARGIKRSEIRLIDNLGLIIKVGQAQRAYAESLGISVREMTAEQKQLAILNEVLRVGGNLIDQVGGKTASLVDPYMQLATNTENVGNAFKEMASVTFEPVIAGLAQLTGGMADAFAQAQVTYETLLQIADLNTSRVGDAPALGAAMGGGITQQAQVYRTAISSMIEARKDLSFWEFKSKDLVDDSIVNFLAQSIGPLQDAQTNISGALKQMFGEDVEIMTSRTGASFAVITDGANKYTVALNDVAAAVQSLTDTERQRELGLKGGSFFTNMPSDSSGVNGRKAMRLYVESIMPTEAELRLIENRRTRLSDEAVAMREEMNANARQAIADMRSTAAELVAARQEMIAGSWLDIFAEGDLESDFVISGLHGIGRAFIEVGGPTEEQEKRLEELTADYERATEKLWELNQGIGVQGDEAEKVAKRIEEQALEVENLGRVVGEFAAGLPQATTEETWIGLNLDDVAIFKAFLDEAGRGGATAAQLSQLGVAMNLFGEETGDALQKVALIEGVIKSLNIQLQAGQISTAEVPAAINEAIRLLEQDMPIQDLMVQVKAQVVQAQGEVTRELRLPGEDRTRELDVAANLDPANRTLAELFGFLDSTEPRIGIDADDSPARSVLNQVVSDIENANPTLTIVGDYQPPGDAPPGTPGGGPPGGPSVPFQRGGYIPGTPGTMKNILAHAGEFVMRPEAVDRLGVGFLGALNAGVDSATNNVTVQTNIYAPVGSQQAKQIILKGGDDAAESLVTVLRRNGYKVK